MLGSGQMKERPCFSGLSGNVGNVRQSMLVFNESFRVDSETVDNSSVIQTTNQAKGIPTLQTLKLQRKENCIGAKVNRFGQC